MHTNRFDDKQPVEIIRRLQQDTQMPCSFHTHFNGHVDSEQGYKQ